MLQLLPTKYGKGVEILGDYLDLSNLRHCISVLTEIYTETSDEITPVTISDFLYNIHREVRKATEGCRSIKAMNFPPYTKGQKTKYLGFKISWPRLIFMALVFNEALEHELSSPIKRFLKFYYDEILEMCFEADQAFGANVSEIMKYLSKRCPSLERDLPHHQIATSWAEMQIFRDGVDKEGKGSRYKNVLKVLAVWNPDGFQYRTLIETLSEVAEERGCSIDALVYPDDWYNNIKW